MANHRAQVFMLRNQNNYMALALCCAVVLANKRLIVSGSYAFNLASSHQVWDCKSYLVGITLLAFLHTLLTIPQPGTPTPPCLLTPPESIQAPRNPEESGHAIAHG